VGQPRAGRQLRTKAVGNFAFGASTFPALNIADEIEYPHRVQIGRYTVRKYPADTAAIINRTAAWYTELTTNRARPARATARLLGRGSEPTGGRRPREAGSVGLSQNRQSHMHRGSSAQARHELLTWNLTDIRYRLDLRDAVRSDDRLGKDQNQRDPLAVPRLLCRWASPSPRYPLARARLDGIFGRDNRRI
jgi:hypothetical protein